MEKKHGFLTLSLAMILVLSLMLAGCGSSSDSTAESESSVATDSTEEVAEETESTEVEEAADVIGEVSYIGTSYISVTVYTSEEEIEDYALLDVATLTASEDTESVNTDDATAYLIVAEEALADATRDDVVKGALVAFTTSEDGIQQVIILTTGEETDETAEEDLTETVDETAEADLTEAEEESVSEESEETESTDSE